MKAGFSIVLCTFNGRQRLEPTLRYLAGLQIPLYHGIELIVVDNASTDDTSIFTQKIWKSLGNPYPLLLLKESRAGKGYAIETGYDAASYSYILTVDDDNWLTPDYLCQAVKIFQEHPIIGILQGHSIGVFEIEPPTWLEKCKNYFIIGSPIERVGFFPEDNFFVWGAGMILKKSEWDYIRQLGFAFLTSKIPGKAAGEDNETALAILLLGKKIFYSDKLIYHHFMPKERLNWIKLRQNFETFGYVSHYIFLYALVIDAYVNNYKITNYMILKKYLKCHPEFIGFTWKQHIYYWLKPLNEIYQLKLSHRYHHIKWFIKLLVKAEEDIKFIQHWMMPLLQQQTQMPKWQNNWFNKVVNTK